MPDYNKACIYMIKHNQDYNDENVYIGSCCNFARRKCSHKTVCNNPDHKDRNIKLYQTIRANGGWDNWVMIRLHNFPCNEKYELNLEERKIIDLYQSKLNCQLPTRTKKEHYEDNKEKLNEKQKKYRNENKDEIKKNAKKYHEEHKDERNEYNKKYYKENKEKSKKYYENNKEKLKEKITCECGSIISRENIAHHRKTKKHISFLDNMKRN
jgi:hypothetical protein